MFSKKNLIRLFMFQTVNGYATSNQIVTDKIIAFKQGISKLGDIITALLSTGSVPVNVIGGGAQKESMRMPLDQMSCDIMKKARGYFMSVGNLDVAAQLKYSQGRIEKISDKNIVMSAQSWIALIQPFISSLKDWDILPQSITDWNTAIQNYAAVLKLPKNKIEARKAKTKQVNALIKQGMDHCRNVLDASAVGFKTNGNMEFFKLFTEYRHLTPVSSKHGKFRILILDDLQQPVVNVKCTQDGTDNFMTTDLSGQASMDIKYNKTKVKPMADLYSFTITSGTKTINSGYIGIKHNQTITRTYFLEPTGFVIPAYQPAVVKIEQPA